MIGIDSLEILLGKYGLDINKFLIKGAKVLNEGEYRQIDKTLNYLINELGIPKSSIERCPSIVYRNPKDIKDNYNFIMYHQELGFSDINGCLHILSTPYHELIRTYNYVLNNYGINAIKKTSSILGVSVDIITELESLPIRLDKKEDILSIAIGRNTIDDIRQIVSSEEYQLYPKLFTTQTLSRAKLGNIKEILHSDEFRLHPELFTSEAIARMKIEEIREVFALDCWQDPRYSKLLTPTVLSKGKSIISKIPLLLSIAEEHNIDNYLITNYLVKSPSQVFALIRYLEDNSIPLVINDKLNPIFSYQPWALKKKFNIDLKELITKYPYNTNEHTNDETIGLK